MSLQTLFATDVAAAVFHGAQAVAVGVLFATTQKDKGTFSLTQRVYDRERWRVDGKYLKWLVVAFPTLSMTNHIVSAVRYKQLGVRALSDNYVNSYRWLEYGASAAIMFWIIAQLSGVTDVPLLVMVALMNFALQFCGYMIERTGDDDYAFSVIGWLVFVAIWIPIVWKFFDSLSVASSSLDDDGETTLDVPGVIYAIVFVQVALFAAFGAASFYFRKRRARRDIVKREVTYATLSLVAKSLLTWLIVGGALNAGVGNAD